VRNIPVSVEEVSLPAKYSGVDPTTVCRTCTHRDNHLWAVKTAEMIKRGKDGETKADMECAPTKELRTYKLLETIRSRGRIVPLNEPSKHRARAFVDTCGHTLRPECKGCDRFSPVQVAVPYSKNPDARIFWTFENRNGRDVPVPVADDGGNVFWWNVTIGGHCTIPAEGLDRNGTKVYCDPKPRKLKIDNPGCGNCHWLDFAGEQWQTDYLTVNSNAALTPWEREQARRFVGEDVTLPMALGLALKAKQSSKVGRSYWYRATLLKEGLHRGQYKYRVNFSESGVVAVITDDDWRWTVHRTNDPKVVAVEILMPYHRMFRLGDHMTKRALRWPRSPRPVLIEPNLAHLVDTNCPRCKADKPCYHHAKDPRRSDVTGDIEYFNPEGLQLRWEYPAHGQMHVAVINDEVVAVDGNGNRPVPYSDEVANAATFRRLLPGLLTEAGRKHGDDGRAAIMAQYKEVRSKLRRSVRALPVRPAWYNNSTIEPNKPRCSHPDGLDLRSVFGDSFGLERTDFSFDMGAANTMAVNEELRVGYRQHAHTPQRLHEEILATDASHPNYDPASDSVIERGFSFTETPVAIHLPGIGGMTREDGSAVNDPAEFMDRLDEEVVVGKVGETPRTMTKRMQMFGYDLSRGYYGSRKGSDKTSVPSRDRDLVIFGESEDDQLDVNTDWRCVECDNTYPQDQIDDYFYPVCECGADLYMIHNTRQVYNPRSGGGVGNAFVMDTEGMRQRQRLGATLCPNWRLRGSPHISLEDVEGPAREEKVIAPEGDVEEDVVEILKVKTLHLTPEQQAHNEAYWAENDKVIEARTEYLLKYPETTQRELAARFPRPRGKIYQIMAAGSLAKMG
jgi:hypothetical protein